MRLRDYCRSRQLAFFIQLCAAFLLTFFLLAVGNSWNSILLILLVWLLTLLIYYGVDYVQRARYFRAVEETLAHLEKKYLLGELLPDSFRLEDCFYKELLQKSNKAVIEAIHQVERERQDYQEYMESWVHEIKGPLTTAYLICTNEKNAACRKILPELMKMDHYIDTALVYAKSEQVEKDFCVKAYDLKVLVMEAIVRNQQYLIQNHMQVFVNLESETIFSDQKWVLFILTQLLLNGAKYRKEEGGRISFTKASASEQIILSVRDEGIGIPGEDIDRVFEKGFTGKNGRTEAGLRKASGMGLYLCKKLCTNLGLTISIESVYGEYTEVQITFPRSSYLTKL